MLRVTFNINIYFKVVCGILLKMLISFNANLITTYSAGASADGTKFNKKDYIFKTDIL